MYNFIDVNEVSEVATLPSEALKINGDYIENLIPGYRTLQVLGREALTAELMTYETGVRDGSTVASKRYPARYITVKYQLITKTPEAFRNAFNQLASILNVEEAELIFDDEPDKFFIGTPEEVGEVPGGLNSITSEFTIFCADPFKYSVVEYEAEPALNDGSFMIDYNGTHKAYPTLEAEFYNEDENKAALTGHGDCGYVAFFNENEKIIQLGNPDETNAETYEKSQTLVNQQFQSETAWGTIAQTNWATNGGKTVEESNCTQLGNMAMLPASYAVTTAPMTTGTILTATSRAAKPYIKYTVIAQAKDRKADRVSVKVTIKAEFDGATSGSTTPKAGAKITLNKTKIYVSSDASSSAGTKSGTFYLWDASVIRNRIRITNTSSNVGKSGQVIGWVNISDINLSTTNALGTGCGLKGAIQFGGGDWNYVTIKSESASWSGGGLCTTVVLTTEVKNLTASTTVIEDIKFKVERTDNSEDNKAGVLDETNCNDLEISSYTAPVVNGWYLMPETYGTGSKWHGPSITRTIPADAAGVVGAENCTFTYRHKMSIGTSSTATSELGNFQALLLSGSGSSRKVVAGVSVFKQAGGKGAILGFFVNGIAKDAEYIDLSPNNKYFSNCTSQIIKTGKKIDFNIGGIKKTFYDNSIKDTKVTAISFYFAQYGTKPALSNNGLYWAKFIKNNCDTYADIPNKFSANDIVIADCKSGEVYLNNAPVPSLGALGNDWEEFYLSPGLNQIGFSYSDWVSSAYAPKVKIRYREVFI